MTDEPKRGKLVALKQPTPEPCAEVIAELRELLAQAERGEVQALMYAADVGDTDPSLCVTGGWDILMALGTLHRLMRLIDEVDEE